MEHSHGAHGVHDSLHRELPARFVKELLAACLSGQIDPEKIESLLLQEDQIKGGSLRIALEDACSGSTTAECVVAAYQLLYRWPDNACGAETLARAIEEGVPENRSLAAIYLASLPKVPACTVEPLVRMFLTESDWLRLTAAAALASASVDVSGGGQADTSAQTDDSVTSVFSMSDIVTALLEAASIRHPVAWRMTAAGAIGRMAVRFSECAAAVKELLNASESSIRSDPEIYCVAAASADGLSRVDPQVSEALARLATRPTIPVLVRTAAVDCLRKGGAVGNIVTPLEAAVLQTDNDEDWIVALGAVAILKERGVSERTLDILRERLGDYEQSRRHRAAIILGELGEHAVSAVPALVRRLGLERDDAVCEQLVQNLALIGAPAVPELIRMIREGGLIARVLATHAVMLMGPKVGEFVAREMLTDPDARVRITFEAIVRCWGTRAAAVVPVAAGVLLTGAAAFHLDALRVLSVIGQPARSAIPSIIPNLLDGDEVAAAAAAEALTSIGPAVIPHLLDAQKRARVAQKRRIVGVLEQFDWITSSDGEVPLAWMGKDEHLKLFAFVGEQLDNGPKSYADMAGSLRIAERRWNSVKSMGSHEATLRGNVKKLEASLGTALARRVVLVRHVQGITTELTPEGRKFCRVIRAYVERRGLLAAK